MNILTFLSVLLPFVAAVAVLPVDPSSGADLRECRPECKKEFNSCRARDHRPNIPQCKIFVCRIFGNDCPNCNYCAAPTLSIHDVDVTVYQSSAEAVTPIDNDAVTTIAVDNSDENMPVAKSDVCSHGKKRCSADGSMSRSAGSRSRNRFGSG